MAQDLSLQQGVDDTDPDYVNGKIVDNVTIAGTGINQDIIQFFQKLMDDAALSANDKFDNETNGYQFIEVLIQKINATITGRLGDVLKTKIIDIGDWDMVSTTFVNVAHGVTKTKIRSISAIIRDDIDGTYYNIFVNDTAGLQGGGLSANTTDILLSRVTGGIFDNISFDSTSYNRGWITIKYVD